MPEEIVTVGRLISVLKGYSPDTVVSVESEHFGITYYDPVVVEYRKIDSKRKFVVLTTF